MAKLTTYFSEGMAEGAEMEISLKLGLNVKVGTGTIEAVSDKRVKLVGEIKNPLYKGIIKAEFTLDEASADGTSGTGKVNIKNRIDPSALYKVVDDTLTFQCDLKGTKAGISFKRNPKNNRTIVKLSGKFNQTLFLSPTW